MTSKVAKVVLIVLTCTSLSLPPTVAEAGMRTGTWRNGMVAGPYGIGWYGPHGYHGGPAYGGWRYGGYIPAPMADTAIIPASMGAMAMPRRTTAATAMIRAITTTANGARMPVRPSRLG